MAPPLDKKRTFSRAIPTTICTTIASGHGQVKRTDDQTMTKRRSRTKGSGDESDFGKLLNHELSSGRHRGTRSKDATGISFLKRLMDS